jgi:hypothetical protein
MIHPNMYTRSLICRKVFLKKLGPKKILDKILESVRGKVINACGLCFQPGAHWLRIRIRKFLGLQDPHLDPSVTSTGPDPAPDPSLLS